FLRTARAANLLLLSVESDLETGRLIVGLGDVLLQLRERADVFVEQALEIRNLGAELLTPLGVGRRIGLTRGDAGFEFGAGLDEPLYVGGQGGRAFDQRGLSCLPLGNLAGVRFGRLADAEQTPLRFAQTRVGRLLIVLDTLNRRAGLFFAPFECLALFLGSPVLGLDERHPSRRPLQRVGRAGDLQLEPDHGLLLAMEFGADGQRRGFGLGNARFERRGFRAETIDGRSIAGHLIAQLSNLALGLENPARVLSSAALNEPPVTTDFAVPRRHRSRRPRRGLQSVGECFGNPRRSERAHDALAFSRRATHDVGQRPNALVWRRFRCGWDIAQYEEADASSGTVIGGAQPRLGLLARVDDEVLDEIAERRFARTHCGVVDLEPVGNRAPVAEPVARFRQQQPRRVAVLGALTFELFE